MKITLQEAKRVAVDIKFYYGYSFFDFDLEFVRKSIEKRALKYGIKNFVSFHKELVYNANLARVLYEDLLVSVSDFFRDSDYFRYIRDNLLYDISSFPAIKVWSAGCAKGQEAYSMAILLKEKGLLHKSLIYGTDINHKALEIAKNGVYSTKEFIRAMEYYYLSGGKGSFSSYFETDRDLRFEIKDEFKQNVYITKHDLAKDGIFNEFNLILCRNVLIYFDNKTKKSVIKKLTDSLSGSGYLVFGKYDHIKVEKDNKKVSSLNIYKKDFGGGGWFIRKKYFKG